MSLATVGASLLGNLFAGKGVDSVYKVMQAGERTIKARQDFQCCLIV